MGLNKSSLKYYLWPYLGAVQHQAKHTHISSRVVYVDAFSRPSPCPEAFCRLVHYTHNILSHHAYIMGSRCYSIRGREQNLIFFQLPFWIFQHHITFVKRAVTFLQQLAKMYKIIKIVETKTDLKFLGNVLYLWCIQVLGRLQIWHRFYQPL